MRKVRNYNQRSTNPGVMFASGLESLIRDQLHQPARYDSEELKIMDRKAPKKTQSESLLRLLCSRISWIRIA